MGLSLPAEACQCTREVKTRQRAKAIASSRKKLTQRAAHVSKRSAQRWLSCSIACGVRAPVSRRSGLAVAGFRWSGVGRTVMLRGLVFRTLYVQQASIPVFGGRHGADVAAWLCGCVAVWLCGQRGAHGWCAASPYGRAVL